MPLVDYASDSDTSEPGADSPAVPPKKKPRTASPPRNLESGPGHTGAGHRAGAGPTSALPPLPASFHDLYASTVRTTIRDDPALHQGRTRQNPHVPGNWPSHIYIEWHPPPAVHALLTDLIFSLQAEAKDIIKGDSEGQVTSFLLSDLATPQPLHISLSRPIVLASEVKDRFLRDVERAIRGSGVAAFTLDCTKVEWHRTVESGRSFLVLRVRSQRSQTPPGAEDKNAELTELLGRCNAVAADYELPGLYQWAEDGGEKRVGEAFHVSIAWSFSELTEELVSATERVFGGCEVERRIQEVQVPVDGVKVKIGNVVTHVALRQPGSMPSGKGKRNLLGL